MRHYVGLIESALRPYPLPVDEEGMAELVQDQFCDRELETHAFRRSRVVGRPQEIVVLH